MLPGLAPDWQHDEGNEWYTPPKIFEALGVDFDLDPAAPPGGVPWVPATNHYSIAEDGLASPWYGKVWLNPPYRAPRPWIETLANHQNGVGLVPADTSTALWHELAVTADAFCFIPCFGTLAPVVLFGGSVPDSAWSVGG